MLCHLTKKNGNSLMKTIWSRSHMSQYTAAKFLQEQQQKIPQISTTKSAEMLPVYFVTCDEVELNGKMPIEVSALANEKFKRKVNSTGMFFGKRKNQQQNEEGQVLVVGLGEAEKVTEDTIRNATHTAIDFCKKNGHTSVSLTPPLHENITPKRTLELMTQVSVLSNYSFDRYLTDRDSLPARMKDIHFEADAEFEQTIQESVLLAEETIFARSLGNERADVANPTFVEELARLSSDLNDISITVLNQEDLLNKGLTMISAVGQAATCPPRLLILEYNGNPSVDEKIALVGKGVTFDSGGLNLKPTGFIEDMHTDMCGAAAVLGTIRAASKLKMNKNIVAALPLVENAIGSHSFKPHSILKSYKGITVEVNNTDAEGRLILADAISYVQDKYKPHTVIDVATLTGACIVALGEYCAGLFSNSDSLSSNIENAGKDCFERCWRMPILSEHTEELKGQFSDSRSTGKDRYGGACTAAAFLQKFVNKDIKWAHLDIAGPSHYSTDRSYMFKGATGFGVQLLVNLLKK